MGASGSAAAGAGGTGRTWAALQEASAARGCSCQAVLGCCCASRAASASSSSLLAAALTGAMPVEGSSFGRLAATSSSTEARFLAATHGVRDCMARSRGDRGAPSSFFARNALEGAAGTGGLVIPGALLRAEPRLGQRPSERQHPRASVQPPSLGGAACFCVVLGGT